MTRLNDGDPCVCEDDLRAVLAACGCDERAIERCAACARAGRFDDGERLLARERRARLDELHAAQRKVDRLDYVMRALERRRAEEEA